MLYQLLERSGLLPIEFQLVEFIASNQTQDGWCVVPKVVMAKELKRSPSRIFYLLNLLVAKGFLLKNSGKNTQRRSLYKTTQRWEELKGGNNV